MVLEVLHLFECAQILIHKSKLLKKYLRNSSKNMKPFENYVDTNPSPENRYHQHAITPSPNVHQQYSTISNNAQLSIQLQREKHRCEQIAEDFHHLKQKQNSSEQKHQDEKHRWASHTSNQQVSERS